MTGKGKSDKDKDRSDWQQAIAMSEKRMMDGMQEICDTMKNNSMKNRRKRDRRSDKSN